MIVKEIENRDDVFKLVDTFYKKIRSNELLRPIFETHIDDWQRHLNRLTDFWETNLFFVHKFKGNHLVKHQIVDATLKHAINQQHFGTWLNLWFETTNELFIGEKAEIAKNRARQMSTFFYINIVKERP